MTARPDLYAPALDAAARHASAWLTSVPDRPVAPRASANEVGARLAGRLPDVGLDPRAVVDELAATVDPGLMSIASGRFFGWVMGGTLPAALGADWLVSAWDQNCGLRKATPAAAAVEEAAGRWLLELLGLPADAEVGFVTGATMASFSCLAAARNKVLADAGCDVEARGLIGAPSVQVVVGEQRHDSIDLALRYLGLGRPTSVGADAQGRIDTHALADALRDAPAIVCLQAGNLHSGAFDDFVAAIEVAHDHGAWVHVDGAFGLWAGASPTHRALVTGYEAADSWATDAHKTLNVPYDCGIAIVADPMAMRTALGVHTAYLIADEAGDPLEKTPELSRRARGIPVWAALRSLGRDGVAELVDRLIRNAQRLAAGVSELDSVEVLNDVVYTQVCISAGSNERTRAVTEHLLAEGTTWMSGSRWADRDVIRISVSNWSTDDDDIAASVASLHRALNAVDSATVDR